MVNLKLEEEGERCFAGGLCASKYPIDALKLIQVGGSEHIPNREAEPLFGSPWNIIASR
jgi:hypothetical protein